MNRENLNAMVEAKRSFDRAARRLGCESYKSYVSFSTVTELTEAATLAGCPMRREETSDGTPVFTFTYRGIHFSFVDLKLEVA